MAQDGGIGREGIVIGVEMLPWEKGVWHDKWIFEKYASQKDYLIGRPFEVNVIERQNALLNSGINEMWALIAGSSANHFDNANALIGVGDNNTATNPATHTDLVAATNKTYKAMEATFPITGSQKIIFKAVFQSAEANYAWNEFVVKQSASAICLNRLVSVQGTKASGQIWTVMLEISLS